MVCSFTWSTDGKASVGGATGRWEGSSDCLATAAASTTRRAATRFASRDSLPEEVAPFSAAPSTTKMRRTSTTVRRTVRSAVRNRDSTSLAHANHLWPTRPADGRQSGKRLGNPGSTALEKELQKRHGGCQRRLG